MHHDICWEFNVKSNENKKKHDKNRLLFCTVLVRAARKDIMLSTIFLINDILLPFFNYKNEIRD